MHNSVSKHVTAMTLSVDMEPIKTSIEHALTEIMVTMDMSLYHSEATNVCNIIILLYNK